MQQGSGGFTGNSKWLMQVTSLFWLVAKLLSWKAWTTARLFPMVPIIPSFIASSWAHLLLYGLSLIMLISLIVRPTKAAVLFLLLLETFACLLDYNRLQPWEYQYAFIVLALTLNKDERKAATGIALILAFLYLHSGLCKFNPGFLKYVWDRMILTRIFHLDDIVKYNFFLYRLGYILAIIEVVAAVSLFFKRTQRVSAWVLIAMHIFNLLLLGPLGLSFNIIVWPWNIAMIFLLFSLFIKEKIGFDLPALRGVNLIIILFCGVLPFLSYFGHWDYYLSGNLYSGKPDRIKVYIPEEKTAPELRKFIKRQNVEADSVNVLYLQDWAMKEMVVPPYPELRVYKSIKQQLQSRYPDCNCKFILYGYKGEKEL
jgi:hypothetical protein